MQLDRAAIESALLRKGFAGDRAGHHRYFHHEYGGKRTGVYTYTSHGSKYKTYPDPLLRSMRQQLRLDTVAQLANLVNCPLSRDGYNACLKGKGLLPEPQKASTATPQPGRPQSAHKRRRNR